MLVSDVLRIPAITVLVGLLLLMFFMNFIISEASAVVGLLPANTLVANRYIWNILTSSFYEHSIWKLILDLVLLLLIIVKDGIIIESYENFALYVVATILASSVGTSVYCFVRFFSTGLEEMLLEPIYGFSSVLIALAMYVRAYKRDTPIKEGAALEAATSPHGAFLAKITYNNLPIVLCFCHFLCYCISPLKVFSKDWPFSCVSLLFSWSYCRFYYRFQAGSASGEATNTGANDASDGEAGAGGDSFAFVAMFPLPLHVVVTPLSTAFYNLFALVGIFPILDIDDSNKKGPRHHLDRERDVNVANITNTSPFIKDTRSDVVQERRRAKALKLLESKMAELNARDANDDEDIGWGDDEPASATSTSTSTSASAVAVAVNSEAPALELNV